MRRMAILLMALALAGCSRAPHALAPPDIHFGEDNCARCTMVVDDARFACALATADGRSLVFDDIGDMFAWEAAHPTERVAAAWVHDYRTKAWIDAAAAVYVCGSRIHTPMGHGIVAFAAPQAAATLASHGGGKVLPLVQARSAILHT